MDDTEIRGQLLYGLFRYTGEWEKGYVVSIGWCFSEVAVGTHLSDQLTRMSDMPMRRISIVSIPVWLVWCVLYPPTKKRE